EGLYLVDPNLNFRSWAVYPCVFQCSWPREVTISRVDPISAAGPSQKVIVSNPSGVPADLTGVVIEYNGRVMEFHPGFTIPAGAGVTIHVNVNNPPPNTATDLYWSLGSINLRNAGGTVWLRSWDDVNISVNSWGDGGDYHYHTLG
ncbi:MAG: hypothetical protein QOJ03_433, partial [Frankiaceae bacterium]|nr:hypothetical protein [Frankiaceae bacterium]